MEGFLLALYWFPFLEKCIFCAVFQVCESRLSVAVYPERTTFQVRNEAASLSALFPDMGGQEEPFQINR